jgi:predicted molibdopterin-dependent oxidoreductase YjgC
MRRIEATQRPVVTIDFENRRIEAMEGDSIAAALLNADVKSLRDTAVKATGRGPYCLMGVCFDCLVEIDGVPNRQACMIPVRHGMKVRRQTGAAKPLPVQPPGHAGTS